MSQNKSFAPTPSQSAAISTEGGAIIVSAAAGSGKTRVLVQRVIRMMTGENPIPADHFLILTFTKTAAAEMKQRISDALTELITADPKNDFYRRQQLLLNNADISTIDSFCSRIVRENFFDLGVSRDFRIGNSTELLHLKTRIMGEIIEERYQQPEKGDKTPEEYAKALQDHQTFSLLSRMLTDARFDTMLESELLNIYQKYIAHPFPEEYMQHCTELYSPDLTYDENPAVQYLLKQLHGAYIVLKELMAQASTYVANLSGIKKKSKSIESIMDRYQSYSEFLCQLNDVFSAHPIQAEKLAQICSGFSKVTISIGGSKNPDVQGAAKALNDFGNTAEEQFGLLRQFSPEVVKQDNEQLYPIMLLLQELMEEFDHKFFAAKCDKGILDYHDLEALVIRRLYQRNEAGEYVPTPYAKELSAKFDCIMVDEYQDTNEIQEYIFKAIARPNEENLFVVGDMKQSIYRFRGAKPELFQKRTDRSHRLLPEEEAVFPALIVLDKNFRSRKSVIDSVNYVFGLLMSKESAEIEYDETHLLTVGADYPEAPNCETELHLIDYIQDQQEETENDSQSSSEDDSGDEEETDKLRTEAAYCASLIRKMYESGYQVSEKGKLRKAEYGDFCIMFRVAKNTIQHYAYALARLNIPYFMDADYDLLDCYEIKAMIAYLRILNNPLSDIDMIASLMCPVFGFTPDDMAQLRGLGLKAWYKKVALVSNLDSLQKDWEEGNRYYSEQDMNKAAALPPELQSKCRHFMKTLNELRLYGRKVTVDRLMMAIWEKTGFDAVMRAMPGGEARVRNLRKFLNFAAIYEDSAAGGLNGFMAHIRMLEQTQEGIKVSESAPKNAVKLMTIHHSKGLEFPICILAATTSPPKSDKDKVRIHSDLGFGLRSTYKDRFINCDTVNFAAIKQANEYEDQSERLRVLYVAMTRAKEKLIVLCTNTFKKEKYQNGAAYHRLLNDAAKKIVLTDDQRLDAQEVRKAKTFGEWLLMCAMLNSSMVQLRSDAGISSDGNEIWPEAILDAMEAAEKNSNRAGKKPPNESFEPLQLPALDSGTPWLYCHITKVDDDRVTAPTVKTEQTSPQELLTFLKKRFASRQKDITTMIPSKVTASALAHQEYNACFAAVSKPDFEDGEEASPTERGTATHQFLQYADFAALKKEIEETGDFAGERNRMVQEGFLSSAQAALTDPDSICTFVKSELFERMLKAKCYPEFRFTVKVPLRLIAKADPRLKDLSDGVQNGETVMQGAMDCVVDEGDGIVIVDYKTDREKSMKKLAQTYAVQLELYGYAAERIFEKPVKECVIYSLYNGCAIRVDS